MNIRPSAAGLPKTDDKLFTAIAATGDDGLSSFLAPDSAESFAALTIAKLTAAQSDDTAAAARLEAQAAQLKRAREDFDAVKAVAEDFADLYRNEQTRADKAERQLKEAREIIEHLYNLRPNGWLSAQWGDRIRAWQKANAAPTTEDDHGND